MNRRPAPLVTLLLLVAGAAPGPADAALRRVPQEYPRVTDALAAAAPGDVIQVAPGTYSTGTNGEVFPLRVLCDLTLSGAGRGQTILDAEGQSSVLYLEAPAPRVSGFTLTGGSSLEGGAIRVFTGSEAEIDDNLIRANRASLVGSGIFVAEGGFAHIHHNVVWENTDVDVAQPGDPHGIQFYQAGGVVEQNLIGRGDSNGLLTDTGSVTIRNNIFLENGIEGVRGRGICAVGGSQPIIAHNLFYENRVAAILIAPSGGNLTAGAANDLSPNDGVYGNLEGDPLLADPDQGDWTLLGGSPAIDAGDPAAGPDPDGTPPDIGPFSYPQGQAGIPGDESPSLRLLQAPNPVFASTAFRWELPAPARVRLAVYDLLGRRVAVVLEEERSAGPQEIVWTGAGLRGDRLPPGVYVARLETGTGASSRKLTILP